MSTKLPIICCRNKKKTWYIEKIPEGATDWEIWINKILTLAFRWLSTPWSKSVMVKFNVTRRIFAKIWILTNEVLSDPKILHCKYFPGDACAVCLESMLGLARV